MAPEGIQPKLKVGAFDDPLEREADRAAAQVMRRPESVSPSCSACAEASEKDGERAQGVTEVLQQPGTPLDGSARAYFEPRFGRDFGGVRVHTDARAAASAAAVDAAAYTVGSNIVFGSARYAPDTAAGKGLLAHELAHVVQQRAAPPDGGATVRRQPAAQASDQGYFTDAPVVAPRTCFEPFTGSSLDGLLKEGTVTVIEFGGESCHPCKDLVRILDQQCADLKKSGVPIQYRSIDVDAAGNEKLVEQYVAKSPIPQFFVFVGKSQKHHSEGFKGPDFYQNLLSDVVKDAKAAQTGAQGDQRGKDGLPLAATTGIFAGAGLGLAALGLGIAALAGATLGIGLIVGVLAAGLLGGALFGLLDPFGLSKRTKMAGALEADQIIRRRYGKYLPGDTGALNNASVLPVSQSDLVTRWSCRNRGEKVSSSMVGWTDKGDRGDASKAATMAPDPSCPTLQPASPERPVIYYANDKADAAVLLHEGLHAYASASFENQVRNFLTEGATEYFTKKVAADLRMDSVSGYGEQVTAVKELVNVIGEEALERAYFKGDFSQADNKLGKCGLVEWALDKQIQSDAKAADVLKGPAKDYCEGS